MSAYGGILSDEIIKGLTDYCIISHQLGMLILEDWSMKTLGKHADEAFNLVSSKDIKYEHPNKNKSNELD